MQTELPVLYIYVTSASTIHNADEDRLGRNASVVAWLSKEVNKTPCKRILFAEVWLFFLFHCVKVTHGPRLALCDLIELLMDPSPIPAH